MSSRRIAIHASLAPDATRRYSSNALNQYTAVATTGDVWKDGFDGAGKSINFLGFINDLLCSSGTTVEFVQCNVARDRAGASKIMFFLTTYLPDAERIILYTTVAHLKDGVVSGDSIFDSGANKKKR